MIHEQGAPASPSGSRPSDQALLHGPDASRFDPSRKYRRDRSYARPDGWADAYDWAKTCPASRHTYMIADSLRDYHSPIRRALIDAGFEPDHMASSIEVTVMSLWEARRFLKWESLPPAKRYKLNGHWVPALASAGEAGTATTTKIDVVHEHATGEAGDAQRTSP